MTKEKQQSAEQYQDELQGDILRWEGPTDHFAEGRMLNASNSGDGIHVFYRDRHHTDFTYEGEFGVLDSQCFLDQPSRFRLQRK